MTVDVHSILEEPTGIWEYIVVFVLAMVPAIEPFIIIPVAIGLGLNPVLTGTAALAGSVTVVCAIVFAHHRLAEWWSIRSDGDGQRSSGRFRRARRLWQRYGIIGLSLAGPPLAGIHLTALFAAITSRDIRLTTIWLTIGLTTWTVILTVASIAGFSVIGLR